MLSLNSYRKKYIFSCYFLVLGWFGLFGTGWAFGYYLGRRVQNGVNYDFLSELEKVKDSQEEDLKKQIRQSKSKTEIIAKVCEILLPKRDIPIGDM